MALNGKILGKLMLAQCYSKDVKGKLIPPFCQALGEGVVESFLKMNKVKTSDIGVLTTGSGKGKMSGLTPQLLFQLAIPLMVKEKIIGLKSKDLMEALCNAVVMHFTAMNVVTTNHSSVAIGSGTGKVSGLDENTMIGAVISKMTQKNIKGEKLKPLVKAFCTAFCKNVMATAVVQVTILGVPAPLILGAPVPSAGNGSGKVT